MPMGGLIFLWQGGGTPVPSHPGRRPGPIVAHNYKMDKTTPQKLRKATKRFGKGEREAAMLKRAKRRAEEENLLLWYIHHLSVDIDDDN